MLVIYLEIFIFFSCCYLDNVHLYLYVHDHAYIEWGHCAWLITLVAIPKMSPSSVDEMCFSQARVVVIGICHHDLFSIFEIIKETARGQEFYHKLQSQVSFKMGQTRHAGLLVTIPTVCLKKTFIDAYIGLVNLSTEKRRERKTVQG